MRSLFLWKKPKLVYKQVNSGAAKILGHAAVCAAVAAACVPAWLILRYSVDVPFLDQWNFAHFFEKSARGALTLADLYTQQNEYRQLFPHALFVTLGRLTGWDVRYEMFVSLLLACFVAYGVWRLGARTFADPLLRGLLFLMASLLIFSAIQYDNWLFGVQVVYFVPIVCVVAGLLLANNAKIGTTVAVVACAGLSVVSTFSSANGLVPWLVLPPALLAARPALRALGWRWLTLWCAVAALSAAVYFFDYHRPGSHPETSEALRHPLKALAFFVAYVGGPLAPWRYPLATALAVGTGALLLCALVLVYLFRHRGNEALVRSSMPWAVLGAYSLITGILVTIGRVGFGVEQATMTRYAAFSLYLLVALVYLVPYVVEDASRRGYLSASRFALLKRAGAFAVVLVVLAHLAIFLLVVRHSASNWRRSLLRSKACLIFMNVAPEDRCLAGLYNEVGLLREQAASLDRIGYLRPPLLRDGRMRGLAAGDDCVVGSFKLQPSDNGAYVAEGVARLPRRGGEPADAIVLAYGTADEDQTAFALAEVDARDGPSWGKIFSSKLLPSAPRVEVTAWAFDAEAGKTYRLCESQTLSAP